MRTPLCACTPPAAWLPHPARFHPVHHSSAPYHSHSPGAQVSTEQTAPSPSTENRNMLKAQPQ
eukprot:7378540-Prymnesium_polylepis.1